MDLGQNAFYLFAWCNRFANILVIFLGGGRPPRPPQQQARCSRSCCFAGTPDLLLYRDACCCAGGLGGGAPSFFLQAKFCVKFQVIFLTAGPNVAAQAKCCTIVCECFTFLPRGYHGMQVLSVHQREQNSLFVETVVQDVGGQLECM